MLLPEQENFSSWVKKGKCHMPGMIEEWERDEEFQTSRQKKRKQILKIAVWSIAVIAFVVLAIVVLSDPGSWRIR